MFRPERSLQALYGGRPPGMPHAGLIRAAIALGSILAAEIRPAFWGGDRGQVFCIFHEWVIEKFVSSRAPYLRIQTQEPQIRLRFLDRRTHGRPKARRVYFECGENIPHTEKEDAGIQERIARGQHQIN